MFAKRLFQKAINHSPNNVHGPEMLADLDMQIAIHYGIPSTASVLAFDPIQSLLAIGTLDGRIKVIGGDNIEGLLTSTKQLPFKYLEFLQNQGLLVSVSNDNDIQVWDLESRCITGSLQWESNITAFSVIYASHFMYIGDEYGRMSVLKYQTEDAGLLKLPYYVSLDHITEAADISIPDDQPIVGILPQPCSSGQRVLIAYACGFLVLWDVVEARIVVARGDKVLQLKDGVVDSPNLPGDASEQHLEEKEISALCWASSSGSILAVGYIDGDILFWKTSSAAPSKGKQPEISANVVRLQLSSAESRLPVIVLHWSANSNSHSDCDGQLFIYGGCEIGSEEVVTVLSIEWSSGMEALRCVGRVDLTLNGSFADMIILPPAGTRKNNNFSLLVLTNPGQLHFFDDAKFSTSVCQLEKRMSVAAVEFPMVVPTSNQYLTAAKLSFLPSDGNSCNALSKIASLMKCDPNSTPGGGARRLLTGGIANRSSFTEGNRIQKLYVAGYRDGSVRLWDATYPVLSLIYILETEVKGIKVAGSSASVSNIDFCPVTLSLAVGNEYGLVHMYNLNGGLDETSFHFITETKREVHNLPQGERYCCQAVFCLVNSPVQALKFTSCGSKLAVGYNGDRVAVLDTRSFSVLFLTDCLSATSSPIISVAWTSFIRSPKNSGPKSLDKSQEELIFMLTKDAKVYVIDGVAGTVISSRPVHLKKQSTAISMYVIGKYETMSSQSCEVPNNSTGIDEPSLETTSSENYSSENAKFSGSSKDSVVLLCCKDTLSLYHTKSVVQGEKKSISKLKLAQPCCWAATFKKDEKVCGLALLYQTGDVEIRSLPYLGLVKESSLMSILRWNYKANMEKTMSSTDNGLISLANGCEFAVLSLLGCENNFRISEYLPSLHDKVLAAAAEAAIGLSLNQKKKQGTSRRILGGIVKGFKGGKVGDRNDVTFPSKSYYRDLDGVFWRNPFPDPSSAVTQNQEVVEVSIDDIEIDEPVPVASTSTNKPEKNQKEKGGERGRLLNGGSADIKPRLRTPEEIMATYRKAGDAASVAAQARNKLLERQEKLERISKRTEELRSGAEDFASLANELVKVMESRKWWHI
ncbi:uncharacterized protein LOC131326025 isoform X2 [Rhododendron vialii]|uniref:uncharacterized protein LOC131326025 isoform X2 n=1 Tax=Rhododendron vialii TaxID=182163 RepID=UPI00265FEFD7|nr:uncharacterized protein LOC131326025 isoform X2 [Rhododendron vialii]